MSSGPLPLRSTTGAASQVTTYTYDDEGNLKSATDPLGHVTANDYDQLNRLVKVTEPQLAGSPAAGTISYAYDPQDNLTRVTDQRSPARFTVAPTVRVPDGWPKRMTPSGPASRHSARGNVPETAQAAATAMAPVPVTTWLACSAPRWYDEALDSSVGTSMRIVCIGGGPAGLYFALLYKKARPDARITVVERNAPGVTYTATG